jgi:hypothetical protein
MKFGQNLGWMGLVGKHRVSLPAGQTFMRSFGVSATVFLTPTYTVMSSSGSSAVSFVGASATVGNATMAATGASTVSFVGFGGSGGGGGTTGQPMGLLLAMTYP